MSSLTIGDIVRLTTRFAGLPAGTVGRLHGFTAGEVTKSSMWSRAPGHRLGSGNPIVEIPDRGRFLIPATYLEPHDGPRPVPRSDDAPCLAAELPPLAVIEEPAPPVIDWCEAPTRKDDTMAVNPLTKRIARSTVRIPPSVGKPEVHPDDAVDGGADDVAPAKADGRRRPLSDEHKAKLAEGRRRAAAAKRQANGAASQAPPAPAVPDGALVPELAGTASSVAMVLTVILPSPVSPGSADQELAAALASLRRALAAASIAGESVVRIGLILHGLEQLETIAAGMAAGEGRG